MTLTSQVQLTHADKLSEVLKSVKLPLSGFFEFSDLAEGQYTVSLKSTRSKLEWEIQSTSASVSLGPEAPESVSILNLSFNSTRKVCRVGWQV